MAMDTRNRQPHRRPIRWDEKSRDFIQNFIELFGREGAINAFWNQSKGRLKRALSPTLEESQGLVKQGGSSNEIFHVLSEFLNSQIFTQVHRSLA